MTDLHKKFQSSSKTLVFCKAADGKPSTYKQGDGKYMALGYFDSFHFVTRREPEQVLKEYEIENPDYIAQYPFELHYSISKDKAAVRLAAEKAFFEDTQYPYLFITMIHICSPIKAVDSAQLNSLENHIVSYLGNNLQNKVCILPYRSLELSNLVILWKHGQLSTAFHAIEALKTDRPSIDYTQTVCGISTDKQRIESLKVSDPTPIDLVSVNIIHKHQPAIDALYKVYCKYLHKQARSDRRLISPGVFDSTFIFKDVLPYHYAAMLLAASLDSQSAFTKALDNAAISVSTQYHFDSHLKDNPNNKRNTPDESKKLDELCVTIYRSFQQFAKQNATAGTSMIHNRTMGIIFELLTHFVRMSESSVFDGICCYLYRPVALFVQCLSYRSEHYSDTQDRLNIFIRGWQSIVDQSIKIDGAFSQDPCISSRAIDLPAKLLEFYSAFMWKSAMMMTLDSEKPESYPILIVPKLCRRIKKQEIFMGDWDDVEASVKTEQKEEWERDNWHNKGLLCVEMPNADILRPSVIMCTLVHEISHLSGKIIRHRNVRLEKMTEAFSVFSMIILGIPSDFSYMMLLDHFYCKLRENDHQLSIMKQSFTKQLVALVAILRDLLIGKTEIFSFIEKHIDNKILHSNNVKYTPRERIDCITKITTKLFNNVYENDKIFELFDNFQIPIKEIIHEGYADLIMVKQLDLSKEEYIITIIPELKFIKERVEIGDKVYAIYDYAQRIAAVLYAHYDCNIKRAKVSDLAKVYGSLAVHKDFLEKVDYCINSLSASDPYQWEADPRNRHEIDNYLNVPVYQILAQYLYFCAKSFTETFCPEKAKVQYDLLCELQELYDTVGRNGNLASDSFYDLLKKYRGDLLR